MDKMIEVRYAGVVVGRSAIVRELDTLGLFLGMTEPMPVGTPVVLRIVDRSVTEDVAGRVEAVSESQELANAGMRVRFADPRAAVLFGTPVEAAPEPEPQSEAMGAPPPREPVEETRVQAAPGETREPAAPELGASGGAASGGHRRIVVDASADRLRAESVGTEAAPQEGDGEDASAATDETGRIPAPDPSALGTAGGKKSRRNRRR